MTHLMFEIHLLLGCEAVCWITSYSEQGNSRLWGFTNTPFFFLIEISVESQEVGITPEQIIWVLS